VATSSSSRTRRCARPAPPVYDAYRAAVPGAIDRDAAWWERAVGTAELGEPEAAPSYSVVHRSGAGRAEGFARYHVDVEWQASRPLSRLVVDDLIALTPAAYAALWRFCCEVDLVAEVRARRRAVDEPLSLLLEDGRMARNSDRSDFVWARLLDVPAALSARRYFAEGSLVLAVSDPLGLAGGTYRLESGPRGATCTPAVEAADLSLGMDALGALYLGGVSVHRLAAVERVAEHRRGALDLAASMLQAPTAPWCPSSF
jgi:predicted acetyltransferase